MYQKKELQSREISLDQKLKAILDYALVISVSDTEISNESPEAFCYGISIDKYLVTDEGKELIESDCIEKITYNKDLALKFSSILAENTVTPDCLGEIVDELVSEYQDLI